MFVPARNNYDKLQIRAFSKLGQINKMIVLAGVTSYYRLK